MMEINGWNINDRYFCFDEEMSPAELLSDTINEIHIREEGVYVVGLGDDWEDRKLMNTCFKTPEEAISQYKETDGYKELSMGEDEQEVEIDISVLEHIGYKIN